MAPITCPACTERVSTRVPLCPHCGGKILLLDLDLSESQRRGAASDYAMIKVVQLLGAAMVVAGPVAWLLGGDALINILIIGFGAALSLVAWLFSRYSQP